LPTAIKMKKSKYRQILQTYFTAYVGLIMLLLCCHANAYPQNKPQWLKNPELVFDKGKYFYAIGFGNDRNIARENVLAILSENITSKIISQTESTEKETSQNQSNKETREESFNYSSTYESKIAVVSESKLYDVKFEYYEPRKGPVEAIGYFDIQKVTNICQEYLSDNNQNIQQLLLPASSLLIQHKNYLQAEVLATDNQMLINLLRVINPDRQNNPTNIDPIDIQQMIVKLAEKITFQVEVTPEDEGLKSQVIGFINSLGFSVVKQSSPFVLKAYVEFLEVSDIPAVFSLKWNLSLTLLENGVVTGSYHLNGIKDHFSIDEARKAIYKTIGFKILAESHARQSLFGYE